jgi:hypothetical protein
MEDLPRQHEELLDTCVNQFYGAKSKQKTRADDRGWSREHGCHTGVRGERLGGGVQDAGRPTDVKCPMDTRRAEARLIFWNFLEHLSHFCSKFYSAGTFVFDNTRSLTVTRYDLNCRDSSRTHHFAPNEPPQARFATHCS